MQPAFLPWLGYFELIDAVDIFVVLDDFQFSRQNRGHRNRLFVAKNQVDYISIPVLHKNDLNLSFKETFVLDFGRWREKFLRSTQIVYGKTNFFGSVFPILEKWLGKFDKSQVNVAELEISFLREITTYLGIFTELRLSSEADAAQLKRSARVAYLLRHFGCTEYYSVFGAFSYMKEDGVFPLPGIVIQFQNFQARPYRQYHSSEFVPNLSILDALFNVAPPEVLSLVRSTNPWLTWKEMASGGDKDTP